MYNIRTSPAPPITSSKLPKHPITTSTTQPATVNAPTPSRFANLLSSPSNNVAALQQQVGNKPPLFGSGNSGSGRSNESMSTAYSNKQPLIRNNNSNGNYSSNTNGNNNTGYSQIRPLSTRNYSGLSPHSSNDSSYPPITDNSRLDTTPMVNSVPLKSKQVQKVSDAWSQGSPLLTAQPVQSDTLPDALNSWESLAHDYNDNTNNNANNTNINTQYNNSEPNTGNSDIQPSQYSTVSETTTPLLSAAAQQHHVNDIESTVTAMANDTNNASVNDDEEEDNEFFNHINRKQLDALNSHNEPIINSLYVLYDTPVESVELKPYVSITDPNGTLCTLESLERNNNHTVRCEFIWQHSERRLCNNTLINCSNAGKLQCMTCIKLDLNESTSYYCSHTCMMQHFHTHQEFHLNAIDPNNTSKYNGSRLGNQRPTHGYEWNDDDDVIYDSNGLTSQQSHDLIHCRYPAPCINKWTSIGTSRIYTPSKQDIGRVIRILCHAVYTDIHDNTIKQGKITTIETNAVLGIPAPAPPRHLSYNLSLHQRNPVNPFRVICYNTLAPIYATTQIYPYTPIWALTWDYRKNLLLREILNYNADIICLQEVQTEHFNAFFQPQLAAMGYDGCFKAKTRDAPIWSIDTSTTGSNGTGSGSIDGCATFYRRDRFMLHEKHEIEFNDVVKRSGFTDKRVLRRLMKGNIALCVVLEELQEPSIVAGLQRRQKKRRLCVTNTHIYWDPEYADVKLWQTWALTTELEKIVLGRGLPLVLMGDYNSYPESSVYELLTTSRVNVHGGDAQNAINNSNLNHNNNYLPSDLRAVHHRLPLVSAYASCDSNGLEPAYTNFTGHFIGTLDYIFYTPQQLQLLTCLDVDDESIVSATTALPSATHPSDHIALVADLDFKLQI